jgi:CDP-glucose 4,6-dehydratase
MPHGKCGSMTKDFYNGKKVFLTGHTGFKGSWLSIWLNKLGADVTGFALEPPTKPSMFELCNIDEKIKSIIGDVRDRNALAEAMYEAQPDIIFHLAAQPLVRLSYENPAETFETNIMGTVNLLDAVRTCPSVRAVVVVTSDKCYENTESFWGYKETDRLGGYDPYSSSKACQEMVASAFCTSFFNAADYSKHKLTIATARAGNVIGGGDFARDRLIPDFIRSIVDSEQLIIRNPHAVRPWQHVLEPLYGYLTLAEKIYSEGAAYSGAWNFGPDSENEKNVEWVINKIYGLWGKNKDFRVDARQNLHETNCLKLDSYKARRLLKFRTRFNIEKALEMIVEWTKAYLKGKNMYNVTITQIDEYEIK